MAWLGTKDIAGDKWKNTLCVPGGAGMPGVGGNWAGDSGDGDSGGQE